MRWCKYDFRQHVMIIPKYSAYFQGFLMMFIPTINYFSRIGWSLENALDLMKKPLQRLLAAIVRAGRRVSAGVLQENANEKGKAEKQHSHRWPTAASGKRVEGKKTRLTNLSYVTALRSRISHASHFWERTRILRVKDAGVSKSKKGSDGWI